jgi:hypothetical protein
MPTTAVRDASMYPVLLAKVIALASATASNERCASRLESTFVSHPNVLLVSGINLPTLRIRLSHGYRMHPLNLAFVQG